VRKILYVILSINVGDNYRLVICCQEFGQTRHALSQAQHQCPFLLLWHSAAAARVLELQPVFRYSRFFAGVDCEPTLAASLGEALHDAGLPE